MSPRPVGHHGEKPSETLVRFIVQRSLGVRVCCYDDRSGVSRPDAIIHRSGGVPLEIVSDPLKSDVQLLRALEKIGRRTHFAGLEHGYRVCLKVKARVNDLTWLLAILEQLEDPQERLLVARNDERYMDIKPDPRLEPGEVRFTSGSEGSYSPPSGVDVVAAASSVLAQERYDDVARKLNIFGGSERHAVLIVDDEKDPSFNWLREAKPGDVDQLPEPELSAGITHLWITRRGISGTTVWWSADAGWQAMTWADGDPFDLLESWDDPVCVEHAGAGPAT